MRARIGAWGHRVVLGCGVVLAACAGDDQGSGTTTSGTSSTTATITATTSASTTDASAGTDGETTGESLPAICTCLGESSDPWPIACGVTSLCPFGSDDPAWVTCALQALRDRTPGLLRWDDPTRQRTLLILADGRGIDRSWEPSGACYTVSAAMLGDLDDPAAYDACLALTDPDLRRACVTDSFAGDTACASGYTWQPGPECF